MRNFFLRVRVKLGLMARAARLRSAGRLLRGAEAWQALDALGIPGQGVELLRVDFLPDASNVPAWGASGPAFARLASILDRDSALQAGCLDRCLQYSDAVDAWPSTRQEGSPLPWIDNEFLSPSDMVALYGMVRDLRPIRYVEIGCGISTRVALAAISDGGLGTEMVCVDPVPRVALPGARIRHIPQKLESAVGEVLGLAVPGSILFFDGSHRSFPGSDVSVFFMEVLPALPPGVVVHIHDIFLPADYPASLAPRYWSEQYLLAAWLLGGGAGLEVLLPGAHLEMEPAVRERISNRLPSRVGKAARFSSFWLRTK
jgi:hypothetical protein